jgi:hypothetical protein
VALDVPGRLACAGRPLSFCLGSLTFDAGGDPLEKAVRRLGPDIGLGKAVAQVDGARDGNAGESSALVGGCAGLARCTALIPIR